MNPAIPTPSLTRTSLNDLPPRSVPATRPRLPEHRLTVKEVLDELVADGWIDKADAERALAGSRTERGELHPLVVIANKQLRRLQPLHQVLSLELLTEWLANKAGLPYLRICLLYTSRCV